MVVPHHSEDPWTQVFSPRGFAGDELISALQKHIRRGMLECAVLVAREIYECGDEAREKLWQRLLVISAEDVGTGSYIEPVIVESLHRLSNRFPKDSGDEWLFVTHAVRYLAERTKDRTSGELGMWAIHTLSTGERVPEIPDYALDVHTRMGQEKGRSTLHFLTESSKVEGELPDRPKKYLRRMIDAAEAGEWRD